MTHDQGWEIRQQQLAEVKAIEDIGMEPWSNLYRECEQSADTAVEPGELKTAMPWAPGLKLVVPTEQEIDTEARWQAAEAFGHRLVAMVEARKQQKAAEARTTDEWMQHRDTAADERNWTNIFHLFEQRIKLWWHDAMAAISGPFAEPSVRPSGPNEQP